MRSLGMKKILKNTGLGLIAVLLMTGCSYKATSTPAVMSYDGSNVDYKTIDSMKHAKVCKETTSGDGDTTTIAAAKAAGISKIKHVDTSVEYDTFLFFATGTRLCTTVYGE
jgi:hypothetical protein